MLHNSYITNFFLHHKLETIFLVSYEIPEEVVTVEGTVTVELEGVAIIEEAEI